MDKLLAFLPTLLAWIGRAETTIPPIVTAIGGLIGAIKDVLPTSWFHSAPKNLDVAWLQTKLKSLGFDPGAVDNKWGPKTHAAVVAYQTAKGLTADGWAGVATTAALLAEKAS